MTNSVQLDDLTTGPLARQIWRFSLPLMFSNLLQVLFNMADIAVVGRFAGSMALGSVGSTAILVSLFTGILIAQSFRFTDYLKTKRTENAPAPSQENAESGDQPS